MTGRVLFGKYEVLETLGRGGMGVVYKVRQGFPRRILAMKVLAGGEFASPERLERFRREIEAVGRLRHPNVIAVHEVGSSRDAQYFTMDYIPGPTLDERIRRGGLGVREGVRIMAEAARTLHFVHSSGIVHRDIKPSNILLDEGGVPHLGDFGLAKFLADPGDLTRTGDTIGTPHYMAPEQARGDLHDVDEGSDIYSLGAVLFHVLTGTRPVEGDSTRKVLRRVAQGPARDPCKAHPGLDRSLGAICLKAMAREKGERYPSALALAEDLERWLRGEPTRARRPAPHERLLGLARRHKVGTLGVGALLVVLLVAGRLVSMGRRERAIRAARGSFDAGLAALADNPPRWRDAGVALLEAESRMPHGDELARDLRGVAERYAQLDCPLAAARYFFLAYREARGSAARADALVPYGRLVARLGDAQTALACFRRAASSPEAQAYTRILQGMAGRVHAGIPVPLEGLDWVQVCTGRIRSPGSREVVVLAAQALSTGPAPVIRLWRLAFDRSGRATPRELRPPDERPGYSPGIQCLDLDGDGVDEILLFGKAGHNRPENGRVIITRLEGDACRVVRRIPLGGLATGVDRNAACCDMDGDGRLDLLVGVGDPVRAVKVFHDPLGTTQGPSTLKLHGDIRDLTCADLDGDGVEEVLAAACDFGDYAVAIVEPGAKDPILQKMGRVTGCTAGDMDGDGRLEIVAARSHTRPKLEGDKEVLVPVRYRGQDGLYLLHEEGNRIVPAGEGARLVERCPEDPEECSRTLHVLGTGDFTGDGREMLAFQSAARVYGALYDGKQLYAVCLPVLGDQSSCTPPADLDGDGKAEIRALDRESGALRLVEGAAETARPQRGRPQPSSLVRIADKEAVDLLAEADPRALLDRARGLKVRDGGWTREMDLLELYRWVGLRAQDPEVRKEAFRAFLELAEATARWELAAEVCDLAFGEEEGAEGGAEPAPVDIFKARIAFLEGFGRVNAAYGFLDRWGTRPANASARDTAFLEWAERYREGSSWIDRLALDGRGSGGSSAPWECYGVQPPSEHGAPELTHDMGNGIWYYVAPRNLSLSQGESFRLKADLEIEGLACADRFFAGLFSMPQGTQAKEAWSVVCAVSLAQVHWPERETKRHYQAELHCSPIDPDEAHSRRFPGTESSFVPGILVHLEMEFQAVPRRVRAILRQADADPNLRPAFHEERVNVAGFGPGPFRVGLLGMPERTDVHSQLTVRLKTLVVSTLNARE